jgi:hypothetical protein
MKIDSVPYVSRVGDGTVPLAIVIYIDDSFIKNKIAVKPIYITVRNLSSAVSGKSLSWRVLRMLPALKKKATVGQSNAWRAKRRLRLHHECMNSLIPKSSRIKSLNQRSATTLGYNLFLNQYTRMST